MTRRQQWLVRLLDQGWVAELMRPLNPLRKKTSRRYIMRHPQATETDGAVITANTIEAVIASGHAIRVVMPWNDKIWVFSRSRYEKTEMAQGTFNQIQHQTQIQ